MANSLGKLGYATGVHAVSSGASQTSLNACAGSPGGAVKMSEFLGNHTGALTPTTVSDGGTLTATVSASPGSRFVSRIASRAANYTNWGSTRTDRMYANPADQDYTAVMTVLAAGIGNTSTISTNFQDEYNQGSPGTAIQGVITGGGA